MPVNGSSVAATLEALGSQYRAITNNLANANTPGFKRTRVGFVQALSDAIAARGASGSEGRVEAFGAVDFSQGGLTHTGAALHVALDGRGFFRVESPDGPLYTRNGKFRTNSRRQLVDGAGRLVAGATGGPITLGASDAVGQVRISADGTLRAGTRTIGRLAVVDFADLSTLQPVGAGCYRPAPGAAERPAERFTVRQGYVEDSNVSVVEELVGLITVTRLYEANIKTVTMEDDRMEKILDVAMS